MAAKIGSRVKKSVREQKGAGWTLLKMALGFGGAFFILIALIGMTIGAHG